MGSIDKLKALHTQLSAELESENPDMRRVGKLRRQIMLMGIGLTNDDISPRFKIKP